MAEVDARGPGVPKGKRRRFRWLLMVVLVLVGLGLAGGALVGLACWPQGEYTRRVPDDELLASARAFEQKLENLLNAKVSDLAIQETILDSEVNGYCAALQRDELWQKLVFQDDQNRQQWRPKDLSDVRVRFQGNEAWIAGRLDDGPLPMVLSVCVRPTIERDNVVVFRVTGIHVGHLPIPGWLAKQWFGHMADRVFEQHGRWIVKHMGISGDRLYLWAGPVDDEVGDGKQ